MNRPSWDDVFLGMAFLLRSRTHDNQTGHGCIITHNNRIISAGFNGLPCCVDDDKLERLGYCDRPKKYPLMIHSEINAITNSLMQIPKNSVAYVTGEPCNNCLMMLYHVGIRKIIYDARYSSRYLRRDFYEQNIRNDFLSSIKESFELKGVYPNFDWVTLSHQNHVGVVSGYFSVLHPGHIEYITSAAKLVDKLIVVVNNDIQVKLKGCPRIFDESARMKIVQNIKGVHSVVLSIDTDRTISKTLEQIKPFVFFNDGDVQQKEDVAEYKTCVENDIQLIFLKNQKIYSSSELFKYANQL